MGVIYVSKSQFEFVKQDYSKFGLKENPFPYSGVPDATPSFYIGQKTVLDAVNTTISSTIFSGRSNHLIITGSYGNGKSHTLKFIKSHLSKQIWEKLHVSCTVGYIAQPGDTFLDIYRDFMYDLGFSFFQTQAQEYLGSIASQLSKEGKIKVTVPPSRGWAMIDKGDILLSDVVPAATMRLNERIKFMDFTRAFLNLVYDENAMYSWEWLNGEGLEYNIRKEQQLTRNLTAKHALRSFQALKDLISELGHSPLLILIDEFEHIASLQARTRQNMLNSLRHLMDMNPEGLCMILACAPEVWQSLIAEYHAFSERIGKESILKPLEVDNLKFLMKAYLNTQRLKKSESLFPFTDGALNEIHIAGQGNIRRIITLSSQALDHSLREGKREISDEVIREMITK